MKKNFVKLPRGSPSHLTSSRTFLGTSMSSKTQGKDFKDIERERVKNVWSLWSLWGHGGSWHSLGWCQGAMRTPRKLHKFVFHNQTSGSTLKNMSYGRQFWGSRTPKINFCWIKKVSIPIYFIHGTRWCIQKNPNFTHLENEHFFGTPCMYDITCILDFSYYI